MNTVGCIFKHPYPTKSSQRTGPYYLPPLIADGWPITPLNSEFLLHISHAGSMPVPQTVTCSVRKEEKCPGAGLRQGCACIPSWAHPLPGSSGVLFWYCLGRCLNGCFYSPRNSALGCSCCVSSFVCMNMYTCVCAHLWSTE